MRIIAGKPCHPPRLVGLQETVGMGMCTRSWFRDRLCICVFVELNADNILCTGRYLVKRVHTLRHAFIYGPHIDGNRPHLAPDFCISITSLKQKQQFRSTVMSW